MLEVPTRVGTGRVYMQSPERQIGSLLLHLGITGIIVIRNPQSPFPIDYGRHEGPLPTVTTDEVVNVPENRRALHYEFIITDLFFFSIDYIDFLYRILLGSR